jgi:hypothetical protein
VITAVMRRADRLFAFQSRKNKTNIFLSLFFLLFFSISLFLPLTQLPPLRRRREPAPRYAAGPGCASRYARCRSRTAARCPRGRRSRAPLAIRLTGPAQLTAHKRAGQHCLPAPRVYGADGDPPTATTARPAPTERPRGRQWRCEPTIRCSADGPSDAHGHRLVSTARRRPE